MPFSVALEGEAPKRVIVTVVEGPEKAQRRLRSRLWTGVIFPICRQLRQVRRSTGKVELICRIPLAAARLQPLLLRCPES